MDMGHETEDLCGKWITASYALHASQFGWNFSDGSINKRKDRICAARIITKFDFCIFICLQTKNYSIFKILAANVLLEFLTLFC